MKTRKGSDGDGGRTGAEQNPEELTDGSTPGRKLTSHERLLLRVETLCADETVDSWANRGPVREANAIRLERAARKLGIPLADDHRRSA